MGRKRFKINDTVPTHDANVLPEEGYYVVESVLAAAGHWKKYAAAFTRGVASAFLVAEDLERQDGSDYIVVDHKGKVL